MFADQPSTTPNLLLPIEYQKKILSLYKVGRQPLELVI